MHSDDDALAKLAEAQRELANLRAEHDSFLRHASHDLREPLRNVTSFSALLARDHSDRLDDAGVQYLEFILEGATRLEGMLDGLLQLSCVSRFTDRRPLNATALAQDALDDVRAALPHSAAEVVVEELGWVIGDANGLRRVFFELLRNALCYAGELPTRVRVRPVGESDGQTKISVEDNGRGFDGASCSERVFQPFTRLVPYEEVAGVGLGLAIVDRIARAHGGYVRASSALGRGSVFEISLPSSPTGDATT